MYIFWSLKMMYNIDGENIIDSPKVTDFSKIQRQYLTFLNSCKNIVARMITIWEAIQKRSLEDSEL